VRRHLLRCEGDVDVLHLACHGEFDEDDPLLSRLYLADGPLYGYEIERLPWKPRLAVLSACETAVQKRLAGDETFGLVRALLSRGAEAVVAGRWEVADESTAILMSKFYRHRAADPKNVAGALRNAQCELLRSELYSHPFYWAPYVVIGARTDPLSP
jgi:CHAT domain-containing protein